MASGRHFKEQEQAYVAIARTGWRKGEVEEEEGQVMEGTLSHVKRFDCFSKRNGKPLSV